ncbi:TonB-dependent receptor [Phenylobacterium sp.]|jgi:iron complex outermembrane receptor protein|uniref:TonB-dependent receptor n=1 Tax=Phenylobacterium sp. TaxID=1871053 RepID=UPI0037833383
MRTRGLICSHLAIAVAVWGAPAFAQTEAAQTDSALEEVVVTAQRRAENLQEVPIAATALTGDDLREKAITRLIDLQAATPSLSIVDAGITQAVNIRGIGLASDSPNVTAGVATYVDGLFQPPIVQSNSFYDLGSIEVLRGPQGTLVGSNSTGGAIFINSRNPVIGETGGYAEGSISNYDGRAAEGAVNIPVTDQFAARVAAFGRRRDSFSEDVGPFDNKAGRLSEYGARLGFLWDPGAFQALLKLQFNDRRTGGYDYRPAPGTLFAPFRVGGIRTLSYDTPTSRKERADSAGLELRHEFDNGVVLRSLSGWQWKSIQNVNDVDASQAPITAGGETVQDYFAGERQLSQEFNLISPTSGPFDWILGAYYQRNNIKVRIYNDQAGFLTDIEPDNARTTTGVFAQGNYELTPDLEVQLGARYSHYKATGSGEVRIGRGIPIFPPNGLPVSDLSGSHSDSKVTGKAAINWKFAPENLLYAFVARGYKPGGFNSVASEFGPETVMSYETGWKSTFMDRRVRTQLTAFYNKYNDFQFNVVEPTTGFSGVENVSNVTLKGIEAQVQGRFGGFGFDANLAYLQSRLSELTFINTRRLPSGTLGPQCPAGAPSNPPVCFDYGPYTETTGDGPNLYAPKWTYSVSAEYEFQLANETSLTPRLNYGYVGRQYTYIGYSPLSDLLASRGLLSGSITLRRGDWRVEVYGTNLTDKEYVAGQLGENEFYGPPREYGLRLGMTF